MSQAEIDSLRALLVETQRERDALQGELNGLRAASKQATEQRLEYQAYRGQCEAVKSARLEWFEGEFKSAPVLYGFQGPDGWYFYPRARAAQGDTHKCRAVGIEALPEPKPREMKQVEVTENVEGDE